MAQPTTARPGKMRILLGDGATPEVFTAPCGLTTKGITITNNLGEVLIPDCDNPDDPLWVGRDTISISMSVNGEGVLAVESEAVWLDAAYNTDSINAKVEIEYVTGVRTFAGAFKVDSFSINATQGERISASISMQSDGEITKSFA